MDSPILRISIESSTEETPKARRAAGRESPAHEEGEGPGPSKPGEVVSNVTSHRVDRGLSSASVPKAKL